MAARVASALTVTQTRALQMLRGRSSFGRRLSDGCRQAAWPVTLWPLTLWPLTLWPLTLWAVALWPAALWSCSTPIQTLREETPARLEASPPASAGRRAGAQSSLACGSSACRLGAQVCCLTEAPTCAEHPTRVAPHGPYAEGDLLALLAACSNVSNTDAPALLCAGSSDCTRGQTCCEQYTYSGGPYVAHCANRCDIAEVCRADADCVTPDSVCVNQRCRALPTAFTCGAERCTRERPVCCEGEEVMTCGAVGSCEALGARSVTCRGPGDCRGGQHCQSNVVGQQYCSWLLDPAMATLVCNNDSDCEAQACATMGLTGNSTCDRAQHRCSCASTD